MRLTYSKDYNSINYFDDINLPDFSVLTGVNGSGKTHLLEAIENGSVLIDGQTDKKIVHFNNNDFHLDNEGAYNSGQLTDEKNNTWNFFKENIRGSIEAIKNRLPQDDYEKLTSISEKKKKNFLSLNSEDIRDEKLVHLHRMYKGSFNSYFNQPQFNNNQQTLPIRSIASRISFSIDELTREEFNEYFQPYSLKKDFLPNQLSRIIWDYYLKYRNNELNEFLNEKKGKKHPVLSKNEFTRRYGDKPWEVINKILERFSTIEYRIPSPEGSDIFSNYEAILEHPVSKLRINMQSLSSGEKILMALIASVYKASADKQFPDILLLDEIDASLHPSMIKNLLETIEEVFLARGTRVILVTHSPTTIALSPSLSVYIMNKSGVLRIEKKTNNEALAVLTEGYATLDQGIRIFDEVSRQDISIISEGNNVEYIKMLLKLNNISDVEVVTGVENRSGDTQLNTIFEFLSRIPHPRKKIVVVWDSDVTSGATKKFKSIKNTHPIILIKNPKNSLANKGIENLFDEKLFKGYTTKVVPSIGEEHKSFDSRRKKDFAKFILERSEIKDFKNFKPLLDKIKELRAK